jgi:hypothetical protein
MQTRSHIAFIQTTYSSLLVNGNANSQEARAWRGRAAFLQVHISSIYGSPTYILLVVTTRSLVRPLLTFAESAR